MKKILSLLSAVLLIISFSACSQNNTNITAEPSSDPLVSATDNESSTQSENESKNQDTVNQNASAIVYFSATGTTKTVAETMSSVLNADLYEIVPAQPYSSDDLNYNNDSCRANLEMNDEDARPEIAKDLSAAENADAIYIGYPIWWGTAPKIIYTFLESYDLSGKAIYLFCTSGGSGVEQSVRYLQKEYPELNIISGRRFSAGTSAQDIQEWVSELE